MPELIQDLEFPNTLTPTPLATVTHAEDLSSGPFDVTQSTDLAVETYVDYLRMSKDRGQVRDQIGQNMQAYHDTLVSDGYGTPGELEIIQGLVLPQEPEKGFAFRALLAAADAREGIEPSYRYAPLWDQYGSDELNLRDFTKPEEAPATPEEGGVYGEVLGMQTRSDYQDDKPEPGLQLVDENIKAQVKGAKALQKEYNARHDATRLLVANPADYVILNAQRRVEGQKRSETLLDRPTFTRFIQLTMKRAGAYSWLPYAYSFGGRLRFGRSNDRAFLSVGVRLLVGSKPKA